MRMTGETEMKMYLTSGRVGVLVGVERAGAIACADAATALTDDERAPKPPTDAPPKRHARSAADASPEPAIVTTVPPSSGPVHGAIPLTTSDTCSYCTPSDVYSRPFVLTSTATYPRADRVELHTIADSLTYV